MRKAGSVTARVLDILRHSIHAGMKTSELDAIAEREVKALGGRPSFKGYPGYPGYSYPASLCVSINDEIVHGIPGNCVIKEGDIVSMDFGAIVDGFQGDSAITVMIGDAGLLAKGLMEATRESLMAGIAAARAGNRLGDISSAIQCYAESRGFTVIREYTGHGIGREMHEDPLVPNVGEPGKGPQLKKGMTLAIEPMLTTGGWHTKQGRDHWLVSTADGSLSAHYEHTIAITGDKAEILTLV
jgi:methionyl aminopeptidase